MNRFYKDRGEMVIFVIWGGEWNERAKGGWEKSELERKNGGEKGEEGVIGNFGWGRGKMVLGVWGEE